MFKHLRIGITAFFAVAIILILLYPHNKVPRFLRWGGEPPETTKQVSIKTVPMPLPDEVIKAAQEFLDKNWPKVRTPYWAKPTIITEYNESWHLRFRKKGRAVLLDGRELIFNEEPNDIGVKVMKDNRDCRFLPMK